MGRERYILVPIRPGRTTAAPLAQARKLAEATGARVRVVVVEPVRALDGSDAAPAAAPGRVVMMGAPASADDVRFEAGDPLSVVLTEAARPDVDLVVMERPRQRSWFSMAARPLYAAVTQRAAIPVVVVPAAARSGTKPPEASVREDAPPPGLRVLSGGRGDGGR